MKITVLAGVFAGVLAVGAAAGLMPRAVPLYDHAPARAYTVLGPVAVVSEDPPRHTALTPATAAALVAEARARYPRPDALIAVAHERLPGGAGARSSALAVTWIRAKTDD